MMSRRFALNSELTGVIAKILPHAKNHLSAPGSFFNQFVTYIYIRASFYLLLTHFLCTEDEHIVQKASNVCALQPITTITNLYFLYIYIYIYIYIH